MISRELGIGSDDALRNRVMRMRAEEMPRRFRHLVIEVQEKSSRVDDDERVRLLPREKKLILPWSHGEDELIRVEMMVREPRKVWLRLHNGPLAHRTKHAIRNRAARLGLVKGGA